MLKQILLSALPAILLASLGTAHAFPSKRPVIVCESEGSSLRLVIDRKQRKISATLKTDDKTYSVEAENVGNDILAKLDGGFDWDLSLTNDVMENMNLSFGHYDDRLNVVVESYNGNESYSFSGHVCHSFKK